jgi:LPS export ABC transporter protein LptC
MHDRSAADSADQFLLGMTTVLTEQGLKRSDVEADTAYFYDNNARLEMQGVHVTFFTSTGLQNGILTSRRAVYNSITGVMEAFGNVVLVSTDGRRLTTSQLKYDKHTDQIHGDSAFKFVDPDETQEGIGFDADGGANNLRVRKFIKGSQKNAISVPKR